MVEIGNWVARFAAGRRPRRLTQWHLVESVVAEDAVTRCGRRMDRVTASGGELQVSEVMPLTRAIGQPQLCRAGCQEFNETGDSLNRDSVNESEVGLAEDDASTAPEMVP